MTRNGYDDRWVDAINNVLQDRESQIRINDLDDNLWNDHIGPMCDAIENGHFREIEIPGGARVALLREALDRISKTSKDESSRETAREALTHP
jgi:hypothetical protein